MVIKYSFKNRVSHMFIFYIIAIILIPIFCSYLIMLKTRPKDIERFSFFSELNYVDDGLFKQQLFDVLNEDLEINIYDMNKNDRLFNSYFSSYGLNSDICLLSKSTLDSFTSIDFVDLTGTKWDNDTNYRFNEYSVGIFYNDDSRFNIIDKEEKYYLLALKSSVHLKGILNESKTDQVNRVLEYLTYNG